MLGVFLIDELDAKCADSANGPDLIDHASRNLSAPLIADCDGRTNWQLAIELNCGSVPVQANSLGIDGERTRLNVFSGQSNGRGERHSRATALRRRVERDVQRSNAMLRLMKAVFHSAAKIRYGSDSRQFTVVTRGW